MPRGIPKNKKQPIDSDNLLAKPEGELQYIAATMGLPIIEGETPEDLVGRIMLVKLSNPEKEAPEIKIPKVKEPAPENKAEAILAALSEYINAGLQVKIEGDIVKFRNAAAKTVSCTTTKQPIKAIVMAAQGLI